MGRTLSFLLTTCIVLLATRAVPAAPSFHDSLLARPPAAGTSFYFTESGKLIGKFPSDSTRTFFIRTKKRQRDIYTPDELNGSIEYDGRFYNFPIPVRGISGKLYRKVCRLIKTGAINDSLVLKHTIEVESRNLLRSMRSSIRDSGLTKEDSATFREFGGIIQFGTIIKLAVGKISLPDGRSALLALGNHGTAEFHSHPSGCRDETQELNPYNLVTATGSREIIGGKKGGCFGQPPSEIDRQLISERTGYVFGMRNRCIYVYNTEGILTTIPFKFIQRMK